MSHEPAPMSKAGLIGFAIFMASCVIALIYIADVWAPH